MSRRTNAIILAGTISVLALFGVAGHSRLSGPVILRLSHTHGVHRDDLIVLACWLLATWACWRSARH